MVATADKAMNVHRSDSRTGVIVFGIHPRRGEGDRFHAYSGAGNWGAGICTTDLRYKLYIGTLGAPKKSSRLA
jgi:hypothetical protein